MDQIELAAARADLEGDAARRDRSKIYGVDADLLEEGGPSVVSLNGVVASLGVTEYMVGASGIREPRRLLTYRGDQGIVTVGGQQLAPGCYYCTMVTGKGADAGVERLLARD